VIVITPGLIIPGEVEAVTGACWNPTRPGVISTEPVIVRACTRRGGGGSPTAVLLDDAALTDDGRRAIVQRAGTSHAAFIAVDADGVPAVRFFTTHGELTNCGHGTIAAQALLLRQRGLPEHRGRQRTGGRTFDTTAVRRDDGMEVWFDQGPIELRAGEDAGGLLPALGVGAGDIPAGHGLCVASPGTPRLLVPVRDRSTLFALRPAFDRLAAECRRRGYLGCFVYTPLSHEDVVAARMFAPVIGVDEDNVNANSAGCLAAFLHMTRGTAAITVEQGDVVGRPSAVLATAAGAERGVSTWVGGVAAIGEPR
jgi:trans-2,3-dihydro-3-hydroxyanthranilate isomerase